MSSADIDLQDFEEDFLERIEELEKCLVSLEAYTLLPKDGQNIETVILRIGTGRTSLCISSQAGCTEKCTFCSTATLGFKRNLTLNEIIGQVLIAGEILKEENKL